MIGGFTCENFSPSFANVQALTVDLEHPLNQMSVDKYTYTGIMNIVTAFANTLVELTIPIPVVSALPDLPRLKRLKCTPWPQKISKYEFTSEQYGSIRYGGSAEREIDRRLFSDANPFKVDAGCR
jgi:hypothetical protein